MGSFNVDFTRFLFKHEIADIESKVHSVIMESQSYEETGIPTDVNDKTYGKLLQVQEILHSIIEG